MMKDLLDEIADTMFKTAEEIVSALEEKLEDLKEQQILEQNPEQKMVLQDEIDELEEQLYEIRGDNTTYNDAESIESLEGFQSEDE